MIRLFVPIVLIGFLTTGCAATQTKPAKQGSESTTADAAAKQLPQPKWVEGESRQYPRLDYMRSRAQATSAKDAAQKARIKLARLFMVDTNALGISPHQARFAADYEIVEDFSSEQAPVVAFADITDVLDKIKIADQWYHVENNTHHALAVLPRNIGKAFLRKEIRRLDDTTGQLIDQAQTHGDPITQVGLMTKAWHTQQVRSVLQKAMTRADLTGRGIKPGWQLRNIKQDINSMLTSLRIYPTGLEGDVNARAMAAMLQGALKVTKLTPADESSADYIIRAVVEISIIGEENGWALGHGAIKVVLADKKDNRLRGSKQWEFQTPGLHEEHARRRVLEKTEYMLKKNMRNILLDIAMNQETDGD